MKKGRKVKKSKLETTDSLRFLRLCHTCLYLNESNSEISDCTKCEHSFSGEVPTWSEFDNFDEEAPLEDQSLEEQAEQALIDAEEESGVIRRRPMMLTGLSVRW